MIVQAKCLTQCYDNQAGVMYYPGLTYPIDTESQLAQLTVIPVAYENGRPVRYFRDKEGELKSIPVPKPGYIFDFDRTGTRTNEGIDVVKDYSCKACGKKCKTLNELGTHTRENHKTEYIAGEDTDEPIVTERRGQKKKKGFTCKTCGELLPHVYAMRLHHKEKHPTQVAETVAVPA